MEFCQVLLEFRARNNLTQTELGSAIGVSLNMIHRYETNKSRPTQANKIKFENRMKEWEEKKNVSL